MQILAFKKQIQLDKGTSVLRKIVHYGNLKWQVFVVKKCEKDATESWEHVYYPNQVWPSLFCYV